MAKTKDSEAGMAPAGWYLDPRDQSGSTLRRWNGKAWTGPARPGTAAELDKAREYALGSANEAPAETASRLARDRLAAIANSRRTRDLGGVRSFEYSVLELDSATTASSLNEAGSLGWELVNVLPSSSGCERCFFKREVWTEIDHSGTASAIAPHFGGAGSRGAVAGGGGGFIAFYESGPDLDADGDVDGGLVDSIEDLFN